MSERPTEEVPSRVFATPGSVNPDITCGGCGGIMTEGELQAEECAECGQRWPSPPEA